jgi:hypothetical protein
MKKPSIFGLQIKPGLILTLIICLLMIILRNQFVSAVWLLGMTVGRIPTHCSLVTALHSASFNQKLIDLQAKYFSKAKLISSDLEAGIELWDFGSKRI